MPTEYSRDWMAARDAADITLRKISAALWRKRSRRPDAPSVAKIQKAAERLAEVFEHLTDDSQPAPQPAETLAL
jgi:hypothetical protein